MTKQDYFEDNLFLIQIRIRTLQDTLILNTDPELFFNKTLEDIDFINKILDDLLGKLKENRQRIDREELLDNLSEIEKLFSKTLSDFMEGSGSISAREIPELKERILFLHKTSLDRRDIIQNLGSGAEAHHYESAISSDEFQELLKDFK